MRSLFGRLIAGGAAYQASSLAAATLALVTLPLYTRALSRADFGVAETLLTFIILASILLRLGLGEALVRFHFQMPAEDRVRLARSTTAAVLLVSTATGLLAAALAGPLSSLLLGFEDAGLMRIAVLGLWTFTNLEVAYALLRVEEHRRAYLTASLCNVVLSVTLTVTLVVGLDQGARGYLAGNYVASLVVLLALWRALRGRIGLRVELALAPLLRFGLPTVPADATVFALNVVDRAYLLRTQSAAAAGLFALSVKLATAVILAVRGFQLAWPPLAYSIGDDEPGDDDVPRRHHRARRRRVDAARPLGRAAAGGAGVLRGARGAALGRAGLGDVRAVPRARDDRRARRRHDAHLPGGARRRDRQRAG
ncbi:MAG TPA: oligosaccharide flippase family protein, partial [Solirubrobacteraceae bacterium]|nr:oligosaccharide flippase family protein [Solirubrobacteraceae bacterium]